MPLFSAGTGKPRVLLGVMTIGPDASAGARITTLDDYNACLDYLQSEGYNEIDTARVYVGGKQEAFTRDAGWKKRGLKLATKVYPTPGKQTHAPDDLRKTFETSLKELDTDCVDIFYLHAADRNTPFEETLAELDKMHQEGKFVELGLSNFTAFEVAEVCMICKAKGYVKPTIYQGMYNAITRGIEAELIPACHRYGLSVVVYNPLAGGLFSGKYSAKALQDAPTEGRFSDSVGALGKNYRKRYFRDSTFTALEIVQPAVDKAGLTMLETALRWMVHHSQLRTLDKGDDGIIIGISSLEQLKGNLRDVEKGPLPQEVLDALDEAWRVSKTESVNYWHLDLKYGYDWSPKM